MYTLHSTEFVSYVTALDPRITYIHDVAVQTGIDSPLANILNSFNGPFMSQLFSAQTPYSTFQQLFNQNAYFQYRLSGVLLAFVYRAEDLLNNGQ